MHHQYLINIEMILTALEKLMGRFSATICNQQCRQQDSTMHEYFVKFQSLLQSKTSRDPNIRAYQFMWGL